MGPIVAVMRVNIPTSPFIIHEFCDSSLCRSTELLNLASLGDCLALVRFDAAVY